MRIEKLDWSVALGRVPARDMEALIFDILSMTPTGAILVSRAKTRRAKGPFSLVLKPFAPKLAEKLHQAGDRSLPYTMTMASVFEDSVCTIYFDGQMPLGISILLWAHELSHFIDTAIRENPLQSERIAFQTQARLFEEMSSQIKSLYHFINRELAQSLESYKLVTGAQTTQQITDRYDYLEGTITGGADKVA